MPDAHSTLDETTWFCFADPDAALDRLGTPGQPRGAVVTLDRYRVNRMFTDAFHTAELTAVLEFGPCTRTTLRDP